MDQWYYNYSVFLQTKLLLVTVIQGIYDLVLLVNIETNVLHALHQGSCKILFRR